MKLVAILLLLAVIVLLAVLITRIFDSAIRSHRVKEGKWHPVPRTDEANNAKTVWLLCEGEKDFLFWPTEGNTRWDFDRAMMEAEIFARDLNRQKKELAA